VGATQKALESVRVMIDVYCFLPKMRAGKTVIDDLHRSGFNRCQQVDALSLDEERLDSLAGNAERKKAHLSGIIVP